MRIGIIGFGFIAQYGHAPCYRNKGFAQVVGIVEHSEARLKVAAEYFPTARLFLSAQDMFQTLRSEIEIVDICTPPYSHYDLITAALSFGYHVLCEKPLVTEYDQILDLLCLSKAKQRIIYSCHNYQFSEAMQIVKAALVLGRIGIPQRVITQIYRPTHAKGTIDWKPDWRRSKEYSAGGILMDHGPHNLYLIRHFLDGAIPEKVSCITGSLQINDFDTEDTAQLEIVYNQGQKATIFLSWAASYRATKYLIVGTTGYIEVDDDTVIVTSDGRTTIQDSRAKSNDPYHTNWYMSMLVDFHEKMSTIDEALDLSNLLEAAFVTAIISAAYVSAVNKGKWISVRECQTRITT